MFGSPTDDVRFARIEGDAPVISFLVPLVPAKGSCRVLDKKSNTCRCTVGRRKERRVADGNR